MISESDLFQFFIRIPYVIISHCMTCLSVRRLLMARSPTGRFDRKQTAVWLWTRSTRCVLIQITLPLHYIPFTYSAALSICDFMLQMWSSLISWLIPQPLVDPVTPTCPQITQVRFPTLIHPLTGRSTGTSLSTSTGISYFISGRFRQTEGSTFSSRSSHVLFL